MADINLTISIITLSISVLKHQLKERLSEWIKKQDSPTCCLPVTHFKDIYRLTVNGQRIICNVNSNQKKAGVAVLISDRADFKAREIIMDKEGQHIMIKWSIPQENMTISNIYVPNNRAPNCEAKSDQIARRNG